MKKKSYLIPRTAVVVIKSPIVLQVTSPDEGGQGQGTGDPTNEEGD
jgi:hypothetical protein